MKDRNAAILNYGSLSISELKETNQERQKEIRAEMRRIERELGLSPKEILEAAQAMVLR